jgi:hypothetical protein
VTDKIFDLEEMRKRRLEKRTGCEGLNPDLSVDVNDERNVLYLESIEDLARSMADVVYGAKLDEIDGELTPEQDETLYQQCLVDMRRMLLDPEYGALFCGQGGA